MPGFSGLDAVRAAFGSSRGMLAASFGLLAVAMTAHPAAALDTIRFGTATTSVIVAPLLLMDAEPELPAKYGLAIKMTDFQGKSANCVTALISKSVDVCTVGTTTGTDAIAEGADLKAIGAFAIPINEVILSAKTVAKLGIPANAPIEQRMKALKGLRIISAAPGSAHYLTLNKMLQSVGLSITDLKYQVLGDTVAMMQAIKNDQVDGAMWSAGSLGGLIGEGTGVRWISVSRGDVPYLKTLPYTTIYAQSAWVKANPDVVARLQKAIGEAITLTQTRPDVSAKLKAKFFPELAKEIWDDGFNEAKLAFLDGARIPRDGWDLFLELQKPSGKDYAPAAFDKVVVNPAK